jgi:hypothetical protein
MAKSKMRLSLLLTLLLVVTLILAGCGRADGNLQARVNELEEENTALRTENEELRRQVESLEAEVAQLQEQLGEPGQGISRQPNEGWEQYFPTPETTTLTGESTQEVSALLGRPPVLIRQIAAVPEASREIWVYLPYAEDPTGLYLFFKANRLTESRLDEFAGLYNSGLLDLEEFWLQ